MAFVGTPRTRKPNGSSITSEGTFLSVSSFKRRCAAFFEESSMLSSPHGAAWKLYPITTPSSPISPI
jgi:hypothetical protein